ADPAQWAAESGGQGRPLGVFRPWRPGPPVAILGPSAGNGFVSFARRPRRAQRIQERWRQLGGGWPVTALHKHPRRGWGCRQPPGSAAWLVAVGESIGDGC